MENAQPDILAIFSEAVARESEEKRSQYLDEACHSDSQVRGRVEALLRAHFDAGNFLGGKYPSGAPTLAAAVTERPGTQIDAYKLLQEIGEGGFGVVYMAEQQRPVRRKVALKIIKPGMDTRQVIARFEAERQVLALMDHPSIAKVFDAGETETGRPYFVMELVHGIPITKFCDQEQLTTQQRLTLFVEVCRAVQHAHQKAIIHRDLKPTNILVTMRDDKPVPKVIDFGIAKALSGRLTEKTLFTAYGQVVGTPLYMSPEQAQMSELDVDTRSDVYSLGVLLYKLLTGTTPFDAETLKQAGFDEMCRIIREDEPPRPSARFSTLQLDKASTVSRQQGSDPRKLSRSLRGELDWIVMKALEKDRTRRYESASALAADVLRYLNDEAVEACPPSAAYRLRKLVRRHKVSLITTALVAISLLVGTGVSIWQAVEAEDARLSAENATGLADQRFKDEQQARREADEQRIRAVAAEKQAEANFRKALQAVDQMLARVGNKDLSSVPQMLPVGRKLLEDAFKFYQDMLRENPNDPALRYSAANSYLQMSNIYRQIKDSEKAVAARRSTIEILEKLVAEFPANRWYRASLVQAYYYLGWGLGQTQEAETAFRRAVQIAEELVAEFPQYQQQLAKACGCLGSYLRPTRPEEAEQLLRRSIKILKSDRQVLGLPALSGELQDTGLAARHYELGWILMEGGRFEEAEREFRLSISLYDRFFRDDPDSARHRNFRFYFFGYHRALAILLVRTERPREAEQSYRQALKLARNLAIDFPSVPRYASYWNGIVNALVRLLKSNGRADEADTLLRDAVQQMSPRTAEQYARRAKLYEQLGDYDKALADYKTALELNPNDADVYYARGLLYTNLKQYDEALADYGKAIKLNPSSASAYYERGALNLNHFKKHEKALAELDRSLQLDPNPWFRYKRRARVHFHLGHYDQALADIAKAVELNPDDVSNVEWIDPRLVAKCPNETFRNGILKLADETIKLTNGAANAYAIRGILYAAFGHYDKTRADYRKATEIGIVGVYWNYQLALLFLNHEDEQDYRKACAAMLKQFAKTKDSKEAHYIAWTAVLAPDALNNYELAIDLARRAVQLRAASRSSSLVGAILYRASRFEEALERLLAADVVGEDASTSPIYGWYFLAMTHHKLGHEAEAKQWFDNAVESTDKVLDENRDGHEPVPWDDRLTLELFRSEAERLLGIPAVAPKPKKGEHNESK